MGQKNHLKKIVCAFGILKNTFIFGLLFTYLIIKNMENLKPTTEQSLFVSETVVEIKDSLDYLKWVVESKKDNDLDYLKSMLAAVDRLQQDMENVRDSISSAIILKHA